MIQRSGWKKEPDLPLFRIMPQVLRWRIPNHQFSQQGGNPRYPEKIDALFNQWIRAV